MLPFLEGLWALQQDAGAWLSFINNTVHTPEVDTHENIEEEEVTPEHSLEAKGSLCGNARAEEADSDASTPRLG